MQLNATVWRVFLFRFFWNSGIGCALGTAVNTRGSTHSQRRVFEGDGRQAEVTAEEGENGEELFSSASQDRLPQPLALACTLFSAPNPTEAPLSALWEQSRGNKKKGQAGKSAAKWKKEWQKISQDHPEAALMGLETEVWGAGYGRGTSGGAGKINFVPPWWKK